MIRSVPAVLFALVLASSAAAQSGSATHPQNQPPPDRLKVGVGHFEKAFYDLTPHKRDAEAAVEFDRAIAAFEGALADTPRSVEAHTYLARIYTVKKDFKKAAQHYDQVAAIEPLNVDACAFAAQMYVKAGDVPEGRLRLLEARQRTSDPAVHARLDEYLSKIDALKR